MRILHTSDWHLGASLENVSRDRDHALFLDWLAATLERERVDVLVIAGDVFDQAHPSAEAQRLYFRFLCAIAGKTLQKVVIVGGNHDSASRLDAPGEVLASLEVHVVGGLLADEATWDRCVCPIPGRTGGIEAVVLAVPFVHEYRLGVRTVLATTEEVRESFRSRFGALYRKLVDRAEALHDGAPVIATGHMTCDGWEKGDSPADVHLVGSIGGLPADVFDERIQYVALGHIHRSYRVGTSRAYYSGSPISLCLKEGRTARSVRLVELAQPGAAASVTRLEIPCFREVLELRGPLDEVVAQLEKLAWASPLSPLVYASVEVERYAASLPEQLRQVALARGAGGPQLVQVRQTLKQDPEQRGVHGAVNAVLTDLSPEEVFLRLCDERREPVDEQLLTAFRSLLSVDAEAAP